MRKKPSRNHSKPFLSTLIHKPLFFLFLLLILPFVLWGIQQTQQVTSFGKNNGILKPLGNSYGTIDPLEGYPGGDPPPEQHPDLNTVAILGYVPTNGEKYPIVLGEGGDPHAPQIGKMLDSRPTIVSLYRIYCWDWATRTKGPLLHPNCPNEEGASVKQVQMIGLRTVPGEPIKVPPVYGNPISPDSNAMVIFANDRFITLKYTREDNIGVKNGVAQGYAIQIDGINVDGNLINLYNQLNASGRGNLPAVSNEQVIGSAQSEEIKVIIRDSGDYLDPRSKLDWWQGVDYPPVPTDVVQNPTPTPIVLQPTTPPSAAEPTTVAPTDKLLPTLPENPQPTTSQPTNIIVQPTKTIPTAAPTINPTPTPPLFKLIQARWNNFVSSFIKFTLTILP